MSITRRAVIVAASLAIAPVLASCVTPDTPPASAATQICDQFGSTKIQNGLYVVQNNEWGDNVGQCISVTDTGFAVTTGQHDKPTNGAPGSYPSIYRGCHYSNCSTDSGLPAVETTVGSLPTHVAVTVPSSGSWDAAYDVWLDPTPRTDGQNTGAEIMVWINHHGPPQPVGSKVGTVSIAGATWDVWFGNTGWNVVSYVRQQTTTSFDGTIRAFLADATQRGYVQPAWYLTSVQFGFEPWVGGPGLAVNSFSVDTGTGTTPPPTTTPTSPTTTAPPPTTTATTTATTQAAPPGTIGACKVAVARQAWNGGFVDNVTLTNTGTASVTGWAVGFTLPGHPTIGNTWNAAITQSGTSGVSVTARNLDYNAVVAAGASTSFGYQAADPANGTPPTAFTANGKACTTG